MRPHDAWIRWLRAAEAAGDTGAVLLAELAVLDVHGVDLRNAATVQWRVCLDRRTPDELAGLYLRRVGLGLREYRCISGCSLWHLGHLPPSVKAGLKTAGEVYGGRE